MDSHRARAERPHAGLPAPGCFLVVARSAAVWVRKSIGRFDLGWGDGSQVPILRHATKQCPSKVSIEMFSVRQKRFIADAVQSILRLTQHPELPDSEIQFHLHVDGAKSWSWADIKNNGAILAPQVNPWNEKQDMSRTTEHEAHSVPDADVAPDPPI